jgi:regulator of sigma E protease
VLESPSILMMIGAFFLVLGPLVVFHELGHYLVGRFFGVRADAFSVGFGKELLGYTDKRGTRWKLSLLPLGGYVQFAGDMNPASVPDPAMANSTEPGLFQSAKLWHRALIVLAGPVMNLVLAVAIFFTFFVAYGRVETTTEIPSFAPGSAAQAAGLKVGDKILSIGGTKVDNFSDLVINIQPYPGRTVDFEINRGGSMQTLPVKIAAVTEKDQFGNAAIIGRIGVPPFKPRVVPVGVGEALSMSVDQCFSIMKLMATGIVQIVTGERSVKELGGPIKIAKYSGEQLTLGWLSFASFAALISINLAFINLLPIPALDGGHLAFYAAEAVRRKPLGARSQEWAFRTGMALVLALMLFVTINDLVSLPIFGR